MSVVSLHRSPQFNAFIRRCLIKNPEERATATELLQVSTVLHNFIRKKEIGGK